MASGGLRKQNPDLGRQLLEKSWPTENPESRVQLLSALQTELSNGDQVFLESIQKDRAPPCPQSCAKTHWCDSRTRSI